jgi:2-polyprenyl-6-methoxyphenol hydroxylase-like FAD-dependent oxidoreductase
VIATIIENANIVNALNRRMEEFPNVKRISSTVVEGSVKISDDDVSVELSNGQFLHAQLLV